MINQASAVCLALGLSLGFVAAGDPAKAELPQSEPSFFDRGDELMLTFVRDAHNEHGVATSCKVAEVQGRWVRCAPQDGQNRTQGLQWYSLDYVVQIQVTRHAR